MFHNGQPVILASTLSPEEIDMRDGQPTMVACQVCGRMRLLKRSVVLWHNAPGCASERCPGGGQRIRMDVSAAQIAERYRVAVIETAEIRPVYAAYRTRPKAKPAVPAPVAYMKPGRPPRRAQTAGWTARQLSKTDLDYANTAIPRT